MMLDLIVLYLCYHKEIRTQSDTLGGTQVAEPGRARSCHSKPTMLVGLIQPLNGITLGYLIFLNNQVKFFYYEHSQTYTKIERIVLRILMYLSPVFSSSQEFANLLHIAHIFVADIL